MQLRQGWQFDPKATRVEQRPKLKRSTFISANVIPRA